MIVAIVFSAHISWLFTEYPYAERVGRARAAGFTCVETGWPEEEQDLGALVDSVVRNQMRVALVNAEGGDIAAGDRGYINHRLRFNDATHAFRRAAELAARVDCPCVHVLLGRRTPSLSLVAQRDAALRALWACATLAEPQGLTVLVEPINEFDTPGYLAPTIDSISELIADLGAPQVRMLFDVYHVTRSGRDPLEAVGAVSASIGHVQFAEFPGRGPPGTGRVGLQNIMDCLEKVGYDGAIGLEYDPQGPTAPSLGFMSAGGMRPA